MRLEKARERQEQLLAGMSKQERAAWRRERIHDWPSRLWRLPENDRERKAVEKRKKRYEAHKKAPLPQRLTSEEEVAAAMADWPQCAICAGRMKPHPARYLNTCRPCQVSTRACAVCGRDMKTRWAHWTTTQDGTLLSICYTCIYANRLDTTGNPASARSTHARRWQSRTVEMNGYTLRRDVVYGSGTDIDDDL